MDIISSSELSQVAATPTGDNGITYDTLFPSLPTTSFNPNASVWSNESASNRLSIKRNTTTHVFQVPVEERRYKDVQSFGNDTKQTREKVAEKYGIKIEIGCSKDQSLHIVMTGNEEKVMEAKRAIISELQQEKEYKHRVAKDLHKYIIGKSGSTLKQIQEKTCTSIQVPKSDSSSDLVTITGPKDGIEQAIKEINGLLQEQSKTSVERLKIPKIYHPWIRGPYNENIERVQSQTGAKVNIPPIDAPTEKEEIVITGEKEKVDQAVGEVMKIFMIKKRLNITKLAVQINKNQHKLIIGKNGSTVQEIFRDYDVYVHVPKADTQSDTITLYGEESRLGSALTQVYAKANSVLRVDIVASSWLHRYMIGEKGANISKITADYPNTHVEFETNDRIVLEGPPDEIEKVRERLTSITKDLEKMMSFAELTVDSKQIGHLVGKNYENVNRMKQEHGVQIRVPTQEIVAASRQVSIRIEGVKDGVEKAKSEMGELIKRIENERSKDIIIPRKFHSNLIGQGGKNISEIRGKFNGIQINIPSASEESDVVTVRGPKDEVEKCYKYLQKFTRDLDESSHREEMQIFKKFHRLIIGKQGGSIKKIKDDFQVRIDVPDDASDSDVIAITGKRENVIKAKRALEEKVKELLKIEEDSVTIPHSFHNALIGRGGAIINQIRKDCGGVQINFPPENTPSDVISLRGPREDIERAKSELLNLYKEKNEMSFSVDLVAQPDYHRYLIGRKGNNINQIREKYNVRILFPKQEGASAAQQEHPSESNLITIMGKQENVQAAKKEIELAIKALDESIQDEVNVDTKWHKNFLGKRAALKNRISTENCNVEINFPKVTANSSVVTIKGPKEAVHTAKQRILDLVYEFENQVTIEVSVEQKYHVAIIGKKGSTSQQLSEQYHVELQFPAKSSDDGSESVVTLAQSESNQSRKPPPNSDLIYVSGLRENCEKAKEAILALIPQTEQMSFPSEYHKYLLTDKAQMIRDIGNAHNVQVNIPKKEESGDYLQIVGTRENIRAAREALEEKLAEFDEKKKDRDLRSFSIELDLNPNHIQILRGRQGVEAQKLAEQFSCQINFSRKGEPDKVILKGYEKNVLEARDEIERRIRELESKTTLEITLDTRVHPRIIGTRGKNLKKITDQYKVDIKFTGRGSDQVLITGDSKDAVDEACDQLKNLEEEYLQDVAERQSYMHPSTIDRDNDSYANSANGFIVKGAPWEASHVPDTNNMEDFPTISNDIASNGQSKSGWGPTRR